MTAPLVSIFFALLLFGLPIFAALALAVTATLYFFGAINPVVVPMRMFSGMNNFSLMSIPFFILAAELMRIGGLSDRLIDLAKSIIGWVPGGLAAAGVRSEEHTSELQSRGHLVCRLLLDKKNQCKSN